ncbi:hypothetical protein BML2526_06180 [Providencia rettgeri]|nr:hypothetical protein BML2496_02620 [Providencia rettgeri]BBU98965.1 hypothetical protein BML2526_06180 [Providencia rettgeri]BBV05911.1 hypothetical protein BML2531_36870 [Providencia rettgeri]BBV13935.1 hypothetical protein BML2576_33940 [Providencia rettgeri]BDH20043.1 hypothetical protein PrNR1418_33340 [Providencia rettgeri]
MMSRKDGALFMVIASITMGVYQPKYVGVGGQCMIKLYSKFVNVIVFFGGNHHNGMRGRSICFMT